MSENYNQSDWTGILEGHATSKPYNPEREEQELVGELQSRFREAADHRRSYDDQCEYNLAAMYGNQIVVRDTITNNLSRVSIVDTGPRRKQSRENILRSISRAQVGKYTRIIPTFRVTPGSSDQTDAHAASVLDTWLEYFDRKQDMRALYVEAHMKFPWAGTAWIQAAWDRNAGREISWCGKCSYTGDIAEVGQPCPLCSAQATQQSMQQANQMMAADMQAAQQAIDAGQQPQEPQQPPEPPPAPQLFQINEGDVVAILLDNRHFYPEPGVTDPKLMRWCCVSKPVAVSDVRAMFPAFAEYLHSENDVEWDRALVWDGNNISSTSSNTTFQNDYLFLKEYHERPSTTYPRGRLIYSANNMILNPVKNEQGEIVQYGEDSPYYRLGRLPFFRIRSQVKEGSIWGEGEISQSAEIQEERNQVLSKMRSQRDLMECPPLTAGMQTKISEADLRKMGPHKVIKYNQMQGGKPEWLAIPPFPQYTYSELERMERAAMKAHNVNEQELGMSSGDPSGRYAAFLEAQSSESIRPILVLNNSELKAFYRAVIQLAQSNYTDDRMWTVTGRNRAMSFYWRDANVSPGWDVDLAEIDSLSRNPAIRLQQAMSLQQGVGFFNDPSMNGAPNIDKFSRMAGIQDSATGPDPDGAERAYAAHIPELIMAGQQFQPREWDDARIATQELASWLRGPGRTAPPRVVETVSQIWKFYAYLMRPLTQADQNSAPNAMGQQQQQGQQKQGTMGAGRLPETNDNPQANEAQQGIKNADQNAERQARTQQRQES